MLKEVAGIMEMEDQRGAVMCYCEVASERREISGCNTEDYESGFKVHASERRCDGEYESWKGGG